ncbi:host specificity factor TipJ family phage tail protein [Pseudomonas bubulae]|uniref:host specificity factor TipJ family phage tail protein n=1 Tax=Pseudomonas bubulae TaxID=2316085 RepID=UPI002B1E1F6A|nr:host specificity factor TipJ family phage tail protein [Pseudomonas bubulae]
MISVFPNKLDGAALEVHKTNRRMTLAAWLKTIAPSYEPREAPPVSITVNGEIIEAHRWAEFEFAPADDVEVRVEPKGVVAAVAAVIAAILVAVVMSRNMAVIPGTATMGQGKGLDEVSAKGNKVKLGDLIREIAGHQRVYPSYLTPSVRRFVDRRAQWVEMLLYVGKGKYQIPLNKVKVGETPLISLGADAQFTLYNPGDDLSGETAAQWWHSAPEVGASANGSAGLQLTVSTSLTRFVTASVLQFNVYSISIPTGSGSFPEDWTSSLLINVLSPYPYTVIDGGEGRDIITGDLAMLAPYPGMLIEVSGENAGNYVVHSYTPYSPAIPPGAGTASTLTGSAAPSRYDFDVTPLTFTVRLGTTPYSVELSTDATDLAGLVTAFNVAKGSAPFVASASSGRLRITELSPFTGLALAASGGSSVLGSSPVSVKGAATSNGTPERRAEMTLNYDSGQPVNGLAMGEGLATIGPRGLRYRIITTAVGTLTVERLTSSGDIDEDWPGFSLQETIHGRIELDSSNLEGGYRGSFAACPEGELVTEIEWDVFFTGGLIGNGKKGDQYAVSSGHQFEYRDMATSGAWTVLPQSVTGNSMDAQGFTYRQTLPYPMRPECRIKRMPKVGGVNSGEVMDDVMWYGLRGKMMGAPTRYNDMTVIAVRVRNGDRLSAQSESLVSVEATRVLPVRSGGAWAVETPTRDIVPWFLYIAKSAGYADADLDLPELDRLHEVYRARGDTFDMTIDDASTVKDAMNDALAAGFSELTINRGLLLPVRDEPRTQFEHMYTPQNMTKGLKRQLVFPSSDDFDGVDVEYFSSITWAWETVECRWPGDLGNKVEKVKVPGISDRTRAWRIGMRRRGHQKYRNDTYRWETELDALNSGYMSYAAVADDVPGYGQSSILLSVEAVPGGIALESTEPFDWSAGGPHVIALRRQDGTLSGPWPATQVDDYRVSVNSLDFDPDTSWDPEPPHMLFGPVNRWSYPTLVTVVNPSSGGNVTVEGMPYDARVYQYDNSAPT